MQESNYSIGYVGHITGLPQSVLRYWETVFPQFTPYKTPGGTRRYTQQDVDLVLKIKDLLYAQKFTIKGAVSYLEHGPDTQDEVKMTTNEVSLRDYIVAELESILADIEK